MANETLARRYATAVFAVATEGNTIEATGSDLGMIAKTIEDNEAIREFFVSPIVPRDQKETAFTHAFAGKIGDIALHTLLLLVLKRREALLDEIVVEYRKLEQAAHGAEPLMLTTARALSDAEVSATIEQLERIYGKKFEASVRIDPKLIGGVRVAMGDRVVDGTIAGRLEELTRTLFGAGNQMKIGSERLLR